MDPLAASLARSAELFPLVLDPATNQVTLIRLTEADYQRASFLDERLLTSQPLRRTLPWSQVESAVALSNLLEAERFIFHIGHVGSTLLSRLLGAHPEVFAVREPAILRSLAQTRFSQPRLPRAATDLDLDGRLATVLKLLSRSFRPEQRAVVKATSFVSELASQILARPSQPKAVFMFVPAETYLAAILGAPNSPKEARLLAETRLARLHARIGEARWRLAELSEGEMVAMSWACEMTALVAAAEKARERVLWLNFSRFLEAPAPALQPIFHHLGIEARSTDIASILSGPEMRRYAKAPEHPFDASLRNELVERSRRDHAVEIRRGVLWLERAADLPVLRRVVQFGLQMQGSRPPQR